MDISSVLSSLSQEDIEKFKGMAQQFFGTKDNEQVEIKKEPNERTFPFDEKTITSVAKFSKIMNESDKRCDFIAALKPLLSEKRQRKADDAVMMLKFMKIINALQENGQ